MASEYAQGELRIRKLAHHAGWLTSHGSLDIEWRKPCEQGATEPVWARVEYTAQHVPDLQGLTRFAWAAAPGGGAEGAAGSTPAGWLRGGKLSGTGRVAYDGTLSTDMQLPELALTTEDGSVQITPSRGRMVLGETSLQFDWLFERLAVRGAGTTVEARQIALNLDLKHRARGTGRMALEVDTLGNGDWAAQGLRLVSETTERADRLDSKVTESVRSAQFMGVALKDLVLEAEVKGLHTASVQALGQVFGESCGLQTATARDQQQWRAALKQLLASGFSVGIPRLQGRGQEGSVDGKLLLSLAPALGGEVVLAQQLSSSGQIRIQGPLMPPEQREFALSTGYVNALPDGVEAGFDYGAGNLTVSGKAWDGAVVQLGLQRLDAWLQAFLAGERMVPVADEPPLVPPSEAPVPTPASAPAVVPAS